MQKRVDRHQELYKQLEQERLLYMALSDDFKKIKDKYAPKEYKYKTSDYCKNSYAYSLGECAKCCMCGRSFDIEGKLIKEAKDEL